MQQRGRIDVLVAPVIVKDGNGALLMKPLVVGGVIVSRVPEMHLPGPNRDGQLSTMRDKRGALFGVRGVGRVAQGQFQREFRVEIRGFEVHVAKDLFFFRGVFGIDVDTDFGLEVRGHFGAVAHECAVCSLTQMTPLEA
jgi:hypothetical protein